MFSRRLGLVSLVLASLLLTAGVIAQRGRVSRERVMQADPEALLTDESTRHTVLNQGAAVFVSHCAICHGANGKGDRAIGIPDLTDGEFLYGTGTVSESEQIVLHGIRAGDPKGWNQASMPAFAQPKPYDREPLPPLKPHELDAIVAFLQSANGSATPDRALVDEGRRIFTGSAGCWDCHGSDAQGDTSIGAPNLVDGLWLKGDGSAAAIRDTVERGMAGVSPAFGARLSPYEARLVAAYTASLHPQVQKIARSRQ